jgi:hypothetical protein
MQIDSVPSLLPGTQACGLPMFVAVSGRSKNCLCVHRRVTM